MAYTVKRKAVILKSTMTEDEKLQQIKLTEKEIVEEEKHIDAAQKHIQEDEHRILASEQTILRNIKKTKSINTNSLIPPEMSFFRTVFLRRIAKHKILYAFLATIGTVLIWRGIWEGADKIPFISLSWVSVLVGFGILWLLNKFTDL